jgi:hypothetical protein
MKIYSASLIGAAMLGAMAASPAHAITANPGLRAPAAVETVACRTVTSTTWRNGRRVATRRTVCDPVVRRPVVLPIVRPRPRCHTERVRVVRPSGRVVWENRQVCRR